ncbi:M6 family metalloprotease domain-containing protein, partial [Aequorivita antarctica]
MKKITQVLIAIVVVCCTWQSSAQFAESSQRYLSPSEVQKGVQANPTQMPGDITSVIPTQGNEFCGVSHFPYITEMEQPNGKTFKGRILTVGRMTYLETVDGYTVMQDPTDKYFKYVAQGVDGDLYITNVNVSETTERNSQDRQTLNSLNKNARYVGEPLRNRVSIINAAQVPSGISLQNVFPSFGIRKALLLLIQYPDQLATYSNTEFNNLSNQVGYNVNGQTGSFRDFYLAASYGNLTINTDVAGWFTSINNRATYGVDNINNRNFQNAVPLIREAIDRAEAAGVNFANYDGDNDGAVDVVMVIHSGRGAEESGNASDIWSHRWSLAAGGLQVTYDGKSINDYIIQAEKFGTTNITNIGVMCHELGHALGLPDLYDTDGGSRGLGNWCLMAGGTWNNSGKTPAHPSIYCKDEMAWMVPTLLSGSGTISNMDYSQNSPDSYRLNTTVATEYFLLENRQQIGWDAFLPGSGLCIYHIDKSIGNNTNPARYRVNLEQADGDNDLNNNYNSGDEGDTFPGYFNNTIFDCGSTPNSYSYNNVSSKASISGIVTQASNTIGFAYYTSADYTALADLLVNAGVQTGLGSGTPIGGVYSGAGVTDDGNGTTYSFDPAAAGVGIHTLTYNFTDPCGSSLNASDDVEVFSAVAATFTALANLCIDAGVQTGLGGGTPTGGIYSGAGVTDDGNGTTYSFDPASAGVGTHILTYTQGGSSATDDVEVFALPVVSFTAPVSPLCPNAILTAQGGGTPVGGVYSGAGVTDDGNGMTYTFDAGAAGNGTHILTYTFSDANGCTNSASDSVTVEDTEPPVANCAAPFTIQLDV